MRNRLEDLGRILVIADGACELNALDEMRGPRRPKDTYEWFVDWDKQTEDQKIDWFYDFFSDLQQLKDTILEIDAICRGHDDLNSRET